MDIQLNKPKKKILHLDVIQKFIDMRLTGVTFADPRIFRYIWNTHCKRNPNHQSSDLPKARLIIVDDNPHDKDAVRCDVWLESIKKWAPIGWVPAHNILDEVSGAEYMAKLQTHKQKINEIVRDILLNNNCKVVPLHLDFEETNSSLDAPHISFRIQLQWTSHG